jgi:hypothetical protein
MVCEMTKVLVASCDVISYCRMMVCPVIVYVNAVPNDVSSLHSISYDTVVHSVAKNGTFVMYCKVQDLRGRAYLFFYNTRGTVKNKKEHDLEFFTSLLFFLFFCGGFLSTFMLFLRMEERRHR